MQHMNSINHTLRNAPEQYEPLLTENPNNGDPIPIIDEWCTGFMKGIALDAKGWSPVLTGMPQWVSTMILYGTEDEWDVLKTKNLSLHEHKSLAAGLANSVRHLYAFWIEQRQNQFAGGRQPVVARQEPMRNTTSLPLCTF